MQNKTGFKLLVFIDTITHYIIDKYYKYCSIKIISPKHPWEVPTADPELSYVN